MRRSGGADALQCIDATPLRQGVNAETDDVARPFAEAIIPGLIKDDIVGAWSLVAVTAELVDGSSTKPFGGNPKGMMIFTPEGYFALFQSCSELPKIASNDRAKATAEEATGIVAGSIAYYGTYSINEADKSLSVVIEGTTFANLLGGSAQTRFITVLTSGELAFANPRTPSGMTLRTNWRRAQLHRTSN